MQTIGCQQIEGVAVEVLMTGMVNDDRVLGVFMVRIKLAKLVLDRRVILLGLRQPDLDQILLVIDDNVQI